MEPMRPFNTCGIDFLIAVELHSWVRTVMSIDLIAFEIVDAVTLVPLCEVIIRKTLR